MSLKLRLALLYSMSVFIILLASAVSIYILNDNFRKEEFAKRLILEGSESIEQFFSEPGPPPDILADLNKNVANSLPQENVTIFDSAYNIVYSTSSNKLPSISTDQFKLAKTQQNYSFSNNGRENVLLYRTHEFKKYYILVSATDVYGVRKNDNLKVLLSASVVGGLLLSGLLAFFYVRQAMKPLEKLKRQIEKINEKNLKERIHVTDKNDELWQIAKKFNAMLDRLQQAFEQRKNFVQHASHELRTPIANMLAQTESALNKKMSTEDYHNVLISLKEDQQDLIELTNSLLALSRYGKITTLEDSSPIRIDELLYETIDFINQILPGSVVSVHFEEVPENEEDLMLAGNESLIKSALQNLIKNAISYSSDQMVKVTIARGKSGLTLHFDNTGKLLSDEEQSRLFIPFFRGENSKKKKGYGLGLSIVQRIINVHNGSIKYEAIGNDTNRFSVFLPTEQT